MPFNVFEKGLITEKLVQKMYYRLISHPLLNENIKDVWQTWPITKTCDYLIQLNNSDKKQQSLDIVTKAKSIPPPKWDNLGS